VTLRAIGVIPARGGSKGVPGKNLREVGGASLLAHAVRTARESQRLDGYLVSTDDPAIAAAARALKVDVLERPAALAQDETPMAPVLAHALESFEAKSGSRVDAVLLLQPTSPIRTGGDVDRAVDLLAEDPTIDSVIGVCAMDDVHPARMYRLGGENRLLPLDPSLEQLNRQDLPPVYYRNGAIYAVRRETLVGGGRVIGERPAALVMPTAWLANVDDERDLIIADALVRAWQEGRV